MNKQKERKSMFKKCLMSILLLFIVSVLFAAEEQDTSVSTTNKALVSPMSTYKDNFFLFGDKKDQVSFRVSAKYALFYPTNLGAYLGYTQTSWWKLYDKSSPFYETNYNPEGFLLLENNNNIFDLNLGYFDYIQISPISHLSNGRDGDKSRSINTYYGQTQISYGKKYNVGANLKVFGYYNIAKENEDYNDYKNNYEGAIFFRIRSKNVEYLDKEHLQVRFGGVPWDKGFYEVTCSFRLVTSVFQPRFYVQYYDGYGEFMINYDKKDRALRAGVAFIN